MFYNMSFSSQDIVSFAKISRVYKKLTETNTLAYFDMNMRKIWSPIVNARNILKSNLTKKHSFERNSFS